MRGGNLQAARWLALLVPVALMAGALGSQYLGGLYPCEMCHWQRWPHYAAIVLALLSFVAPRTSARVALVVLAGVAIAISGGVGVFHAGVEYGWWQGITGCATPFSGSGGDMLDAIMKAPVIRCDVPQWTLAGISLAGFNAIFSLAGALAIFVLAGKRA
ncbi:disulfide bond formation protein B [Sphingomonas sp. PL-96]|uniref:disulfide bond formation protein B n=1 Tax=Sphingomonas sp. PL-96 TaxID=2887201 RepID=UPI001E4E29BA|nr:disulfide bond formation protein B [Sphingomonas sp. PL-96]MCC2977543.1 disulfide bond formation protein B [Sphingomonas sp. PL-96]